MIICATIKVDGLLVWLGRLHSVIIELQVRILAPHMSNKQSYFFNNLIK
jgi:hypothetical protein